VPEDAAYTSDTITDLADLYLHWTLRYGLRADVLWAQMLLETDGLRFSGRIDAEQHNLAGLKTADGSGFASFPSPERGVIAHCVHIAWYCYRDHVRPECNDHYDPRHFGVRRSGTVEPHHGGVQIVQELSGTWAEGLDYDRGICRVWNNGV